MLNVTTEQAYWQQGRFFVVGVDEVGRGALAGPVVAGAAVFPADHQAIDGINDSKLVTPHRREQLDQLIRAQATAIGIGLVGAAEIDRIGIIKATMLAMKQACLAVGKIDVILVDGPHLLGLDRLNRQVHSVVHGDRLIYSIAAASIVAKVYRDRLLTQLAADYPQYGWQCNKGYGTKAHQAAINMWGLTPWHRKSFTARQ